MKHTATITLLSVAVILVGCSTVEQPVGQQPKAETSDSSIPPGSGAGGTQADGGKRPVKETGIWSDFFNPCTTFTQEQLEKAGLTEKLERIFPEEENRKLCGFGHADYKALPGAFGVSTDRLSKEKITSKGLLLKDQADNNVQGSYTHKSLSDELDQCFAAVDFSWGRFVVSYADLAGSATEEYLCPEPTAILESLLSQTSGI